MHITRVIFRRLSEKNTLFIEKKRGYFPHPHTVSRCGTLVEERGFSLLSCFLSLCSTSTTTVRPSIERPINKASGVALVTTFHPRILTHQPPLCTASLSTIQRQTQHLHRITDPFSSALKNSWS